jgi:hypothetical protein
MQVVLTKANRDRKKGNGLAIWRRNSLKFTLSNGGNEAKVVHVTTFPNQIANPQDQVAHFLDRLTKLYQETKSERTQAAAAPAPEAGFSILEELEMLTVNISGYATQIQATGKVKNTEKAIGDLRQFNVFEHPVVSQFYQQAGNDYPKLQAYIQLLDYLRLLSLEYLQSVNPIPSQLKV